MVDHAAQQLGLFGRAAAGDVQALAALHHSGGAAAEQDHEQRQDAERDGDVDPFTTHQTSDVALPERHRVGDEPRHEIVRAFDDGIVAARDGEHTRTGGNRATQRGQRGRDGGAEVAARFEEDRSPWRLAVGRRSELIRYLARGGVEMGERPLELRVGARQPCAAFGGQRAAERRLDVSRGEHILDGRAVGGAQVVEDTLQIEARGQHGDEGDDHQQPDEADQEPRSRGRCCETTQDVGEPCHGCDQIGSFSRATKAAWASSSAVVGAMRRGVRSAGTVQATFAPFRPAMKTRPR